VKLSCAESCTGGLITALLTDFAGSSDVVECGFVVYSNRAKMDMLDVPALLLEHHGAVSEPVARAMAEGARIRSKATLAVSVTGIAGPGGGTEAKPVGLVHLACAAQSLETLHRREVFAGSRSEIRMRAVDTALDLLLLQAERLSWGAP
jgi:nicotinamide-nucleotide amidase